MKETRTVALAGRLILAALIIAALMLVPSPAAAAEQPQDYLVLIDLTALSGRGNPRAGSNVHALDLLLPQLLALQQQGLLEGVEPIPSAGAVLLRNPQPGALSEIAQWPGVAEVREASPDAMEVAHTRVEAAAKSSAIARDLRLSAPASTLSPADDLARVRQHQLEVGVDTAEPNSVNSLYAIQIYLNSSFVGGYVETPGLPIALTLKNASGVTKSYVTTVSSDSGDFSAYFSAAVVGGDQVIVELPGEPAYSVYVIPLTADPDKVADAVHGFGPANDMVSLQLYSVSTGSWYWLDWVPTDSTGRYEADFSSQVDILMGDSISLYYFSPEGVSIVLSDVRVPGVGISPADGTAWGYTTPGASVTLTLRNSAGAVKAARTVQADTYDGFFWTGFQSDDPCAVPPQMDVGDRVDVQVETQPVITVQAVMVTLDSIDAGTNVLAGSAPANGKVKVYVSDDYLAESASFMTAVTAAGQYAVDFSPVLDFGSGSYGAVTYHDTLDNEVSGAVRYAGPWAEVSMGGYSGLEVAANPNERVTAFLRNALGAIKGTATGLAGRDGYLYLDFRDTDGNWIDAVAGDRVELLFGRGLTLIVDTVGIEVIIDRDARTVFGTGPANAQVQLIYDYNTAATVATDSNGYFSYTFSWLTGGDAVEAVYRDAQGNDVSYYSNVPQFTIYPDDNYLYGYGTPGRTVVATIRDSGGLVKGAVSSMTDSSGYYYLAPVGVDIVVGDTVIVDNGPLHYEQQVVSLTIAADVVNDAVYGKVPPDAWLNVFAQLSSHGPYNQWLYKYFDADSAGNYWTDFTGSRSSGPGNIRGGYYLRVLYWEGGYFDRVSVGYYLAPSLTIDPDANTISGYTTPGAVGTITVRSSSGTVKATGTVTANQPSGAFSYVPGVDLIAGDTVRAQLGALNHTASVIPLQGALDLGADAVGGVSLPNEQIGLDIYHWRDSYFSTYTENGSLSRFVNTDGGGTFGLSVPCLADLVPGDYFILYHIDDQDTYYRSYFYTTQPVITVKSYPTAVQPGAPVEVHFDVTGGMHPSSGYVRWDTVSHAQDNAYTKSASYRPLALGRNVATFNAPVQGTVYFKVYGSVDGRAVWSQEHSLLVQGEVATTLVDPVSGTTNDATPHI